VETLQRYHWREYELGLLAQRPHVADRAWPWASVPMIVGREVLEGGRPSTTDDADEVAQAEP
jgi:hypothetical protein